MKKEYSGYLACGTHCEITSEAIYIGTQKAIYIEDTYNDKEWENIKQVFIAEIERERRSQTNNSQTNH